mmetsp:Transcript_120023/g.238962  ORF Transcript_120023/g.238962 Transcript_120023/m.238962 type:complete len:182 (+) Transcript_120023:1036-1581(+)
MSLKSVGLLRHSSSEVRHAMSRMPHGSRSMVVRTRYAVEQINMILRTITSGFSGGFTLWTTAKPIVSVCQNAKVLSTPPSTTMAAVSSGCGILEAHSSILGTTTLHVSGTIDNFNAAIMPTWRGNLRNCFVQVFGVQQLCVFPLPTHWREEPSLVVGAQGSVVRICWPWSVSAKCKVHVRK